MSMYKLDDLYIKFNKFTMKIQTLICFYFSFFTLFMGEFYDWCFFVQKSRKKKVLLLNLCIYFIIIMNI